MQTFMKRNQGPDFQPLPKSQRRGALLAFAAAALVLSMARSAGLAARPPLSIAQYVQQFESRYSDVRTLQADFTQNYYAWGRTRMESGAVYLARGGKMRWVYQKPEEKIFVSDGKQLLFYVPAEKQLTISSTHDAGESGIPLNILLSHLQLSRIFSRVEFADQALEAAPGDHVIRGYPRLLSKRDYRSVLVELTPQFDVRRLVVFYPDNSTMQFTFSNIERNKPLNPSLFVFAPPPGTEIIHQ